MKLGEKILNCRKKLGLSQEQLGEKVGVSRQTVSKWESNNAVPELEKLIKLSEIYNVTLDELVKGVSNKEIFDKKRNSKKLFKILLVIILIVLVILSIIYALTINRRINIVNDIGKTYKKEFFEIGNSKSGYVKEITIKEEKDEIIEECYNEYYYYVSDEERIVKIDVFETEDMNEPKELIYIDLNKEDENLLYDGVVKVNMKTGAKEIINDYEFYSPIRRATECLNFDEGMIYEWDENPKAKEFAFDLENKLIKRDDVLAWNVSQNIEDCVTKLEMAMGNDSFGMFFERNETWVKNSKEKVIITMFTMMEMIDKIEIPK